MHKTLIGLAAAAGLGLATVAAPAPANAYCVGCAVGAGVLGGVVAGAIVGNAIANSPPPPPPPGYYPPPATIRRPHRPMVPAMRNSRLAVIGASAKYGSRVPATDGAPSKSASNYGSAGGQPVTMPVRVEFGRPAS